MSAPTAGWRSDQLVTSLARSGWGDLRGHHLRGVRNALDGLMRLLPYGSAEGFATVAQIADTGGMSERWARNRLHLLEDAGIIRWTRGGVTNGKPLPSHFRIAKRVLVELIGGARPMLAAIQRARAERTAARLAGRPFIRAHGRYNRRSVHAELSADPHPPRGGAGRSAPPREPIPDTDTVTRGVAAVREALATARRAGRTA